MEIEQAQQEQASAPQGARIPSLNIRKQNYVRLEQGNSSARCCLQTEETQIICTLVGPFHGNKVNQQDCEIRASVNYLQSSTQAGPDSDIILRRELTELLVDIVDVKKYPKSALSLTFDVIAFNGALFPYLVNIACFALCLAGVQISDMFAGINSGLIGNRLIVDPSEKELSQMDKKMSIVQLNNSQRIVYLDMQGSLDFDEIQKVQLLISSDFNQIFWKTG